MITIKNISSATVVIALPDLHFRRELVPGREVPIKQEEYEAMVFDPGVATMIHDHFIVVNGVEDQTLEKEASNVFDTNAIRTMLEKQDITAFAKFIPTAAPAEKDTVAKLAVELGITNSGFAALIKKYCDVDIINAISVKHQLEE